MEPIKPPRRQNRTLPIHAATERRTLPPPPRRVRETGNPHPRFPRNPRRPPLHPPRRLHHRPDHLPLLPIRGRPFRPLHRLGPRPASRHQHARKSKPRDDPCPRSPPPPQLGPQINPAPATPVGTSARAASTSTSSHFLSSRSTYEILNISMR